MTQPKSKVIRAGKMRQIRSEEIVIGDYLLIEEGGIITADGEIINSHDFSVDESTLTGESLPVWKSIHSESKWVSQGSMVSSGTAVIIVKAIGNQTQLGKIGNSLELINEEKTPLETQIVNFVQKMALIGLIVFIFFWGINFYHSQNLLDSLLQALTLAMSILPEEIPIAFTTFMAIGSWRLMNLGIIIKQMKTVETLGSATVICTDKTGTITENRMSLAKIFSLETQQTSDLKHGLTDADKEVLSLAMWASEIIPYDPMEIALHEAYSIFMKVDNRSAYKMIQEYALGGTPPMMTHIFENELNHQIIAAKGAPEALIKVSTLTAQQIHQIEEVTSRLGLEGYRVLGVGEATLTTKQFPSDQKDLRFEFKGLIAFYDPPKSNIRLVLESFYQAGVKVKIITGDNSSTTVAIAKQIGFEGSEFNITGNELMQLSDEVLQKRVSSINIFSRMFPEAKLRVINALKANHEIIAMTGDGVNDGLALKAAHIGIAMGKKGSEIAKQAASLILVDDDLSKLVNAIAMGRRIYANLKKAIQYIISIHIPIITTLFIPLVLNWTYPNIFSPIHIIFLELIMGPTCSIIYENEPTEKNIMTQKPRPITKTFFNWSELIISILQGLVITIGALFTYRYAVDHQMEEALTRTMTFTVLIVSNIFLTLTNRSGYYSMFVTIRYKNDLIWWILAITLSLLLGMLYLKPANIFFELVPLNFTQFFISFSIGCICVLWYEFYKWGKRIL
jgi:Ca2+-transporting ATPase